MANYTKTTIGKENRIELHEKLSLTGAEISLNELPAGANVPFVHSHKENEEIYGILSGKRKFSGTFYSRGCRNRLIKSIYLQKCTVHDKLRTVHFFFVQYYVFSIFQTRSYLFVPSSLKLFFNDFSVGKIEPIKNTSCITMIIMLNIPIVSSILFAPNSRCIRPYKQFFHRQTNRTNIMTR